MSRRLIDLNAPPSSPTGQEGGAVLTVVVALAVTLSRHAGEMLSGGASQTGHVLGVLLDALLTVPVVGAAVWLASRTAALLYGGVPHLSARRRCFRCTSCRCSRRWPRC